MNKRKRTIMLGHRNLARKVLSQTLPTPHSYRRATMNQFLPWDVNYYATVQEARRTNPAMLARLGRLFSEYSRHVDQPCWGNHYYEKLMVLFMMRPEIYWSRQEMEASTPARITDLVGNYLTKQKVSHENHS